MQASGEGVAQCFSLLGKTRFDQFEKNIQQFDRDERFLVNIDPQNGGIHFWSGVEGTCWDLCSDAGRAINLHAQRQQAEVTGLGTDAFGNFLLDGQYNTARLGVAFEQVTDDGRCDVVRDVRNDKVIGLIDDL